MKTQKQMKKSFLLTSIGSLILALLAFGIESLCRIPCSSFFVGLFLGLFGSSFVAYAVAAIQHKAEFKNLLIRICVLSANANNHYCVYRNQFSMAIKVKAFTFAAESLSNIRVTISTIRHEIIQLQAADELKKYASMQQNIVAYCSLLSEVAEQCADIDKSMYKLIELLNSDDSDAARDIRREIELIDNSMILKEKYSSRLEEYLCKFKDFTNPYIKGKV